MRLLLTSDGITSEAIKSEFLGLLDKPPEKIKILRIAYNRDEDSLARSRAPLAELGVKDENMHIIDISKDEKSDSLDDYDAVYVLGGNTFAILDKIRKLGMEKMIIDFINSGKLYIGISAGSMIVGPNIGVSGIGEENDVGLTDFSGLNIIDFEISPHFNDEEAIIIKKFQSKADYKIQGLEDGKAIVVKDKEIKII